MKKALGVLVLMIVFCFGIGAGQYFYEKGLTIPGLAMASSKPKVTSWHAVEFTNPNAAHRYAIFVLTDRPADKVEIKGGGDNRKIGIYYK